MSFQNAFNSLTGLNLTTLATGTAAADVNAASSAFIPSSVQYVQVSTCTSSNNALTLPVQPTLNMPLIVRNDGVNVLNLFAGSSTATINGIAGSVVNGQALVGGNGGQIEIMAISNNGAANTATGANVYNNPVIAWQVLGYSGPSPVIFLPSTFTNAAPYVHTMNQSGSIFMVPAMGAAGKISVPTASTAVAGFNSKYIMNGTAGFIVEIGITSAANISGVLITTSTTTPSSVQCTAKSFVNFTATAIVGDYVTMVCDGVNYYASGVSQVTAGLTVTA